MCLFICFYVSFCFILVFASQGIQIWRRVENMSLCVTMTEAVRRHGLLMTVLPWMRWPAPCLSDLVCQNSDALQQFWWPGSKPSAGCFLGVDTSQELAPSLPGKIRCGLKAVTQPGPQQTPKPFQAHSHCSAPGRMEPASRNGDSQNSNWVKFPDKAV